MRRLLIVVFLLGFSPFLFSAFSLEIKYTISLKDPISHYFHVQIAINGIQEESLDFQMPAWSPGRYEIQNFAKNVRDFQAKSEEQPLSFQKIDKQTWRVQTNHNDGVTVSYQVYANTLSGDYSQLNGQHAFVDGASVYMYLVGYKSNPVRLSIQYPQHWFILSSAGELGQSEFEFPHYDRMIDELAQLGEFHLERFRIENTEYRVCIVNNGVKKHIPTFVDNIRKLQQTAVSMLGPLDTDTITFFFHFLPDSRTTAGMEHLNCFQITRNHDLSEYNTQMDWTYWIAAHELIHAWNVKRLRPQNLGPFDYTQEVYTKLLWFAEGCTSYLADLLMLRSGLWTQEKFFERLSENIKQFRSTPGRHERSAEQASFDTWLVDHSPNADWNNVWINYYLKGQLIGYCMDIEIRHRTKNKNSFEDFFRLFYERMYLESEADSYYIQGRAYTTNDILQALEDTTGTSWNHFYKNMIATPGDIPFEFYLDLAGLNLIPKEGDIPVPYTGMHLKSAPGGYPQIDWIADRSPSAYAGLDHFDILIAFNDERVLMRDFEDVLHRHTQDENIVEMTLLRDDRLLRVPLEINPKWMEVEYKIEPAGKTTLLSKRIREDWLK